MKIRLNDLRRLIREVLEEDLKNIGSKHEKTVSGSAVIRKMHDAPGVLDALQKIKSPNELAQVIEALMDAVPMTKREAILHVLDIVMRHERSARKR